jgi:hypothetical protein
VQRDMQIGGSFASSVYSEPRLTYDIDISMQLSIEQAAQAIKRQIRETPTRYWCNADRPTGAGLYLHRPVG